MQGSSGNFSGGDDSPAKRATYTRFSWSPTKLCSPASPLQLRSPLVSAPPQVYQREVSRLKSALDIELAALQADLDYMVGQWQEEMERLEQTLGSKGLETLLDHLQKINPKQARELRNFADELTGVLATSRVLRQLHRPVKVMQEWDAISNQLQKDLDPAVRRQNLLTPREQSAFYYLHSAMSLGRAAAFSCYLAGVAGAALPSLLLAGLILVPAGIHATIMVRDHFRFQEMYHKNRGQAFENMGRALRGLQSWPNCSMDDAMAMLCFRDAVSRLPEKSRPAALDARRAQFAALRDQAFMPVNVLASCIGQILTLVLAPQWASSLVLNASSVAYFVQGLLDLLQGNVESEKAGSQTAALKDWLALEAEGEALKAWAGENRLHQAAHIALKAHVERSLAELNPERFGARARQFKGGFNFVNSALALSGGTLPLFRLAPRSLATIAGTIASSASLLYMAATATKVHLRDRAKGDASERRRQAQMLLALNDPQEVLARMVDNDGRPLVIEIPQGPYDEFKGFARVTLEVRPWENEFVALEAMAEAIELFALGDDDGSDEFSIAHVMTEVWKMKALDWVNLLRVATSMRNPADRVAFIKHRLAGVMKIDFALDANGLEPELPGPVLIQAFLRKLESEDYGELESMIAQASDDPSRLGPALREKFERELLRFGEEAFLAAMDETWAGRKRYDKPSRARLQLQVLQTLAGHLRSEQQSFRDRLIGQLEGADAKQLERLAVSSTDVAVFIDELKKLLDAPPGARGARRQALYHLAHMQLTQDLLTTPQSFARFASYYDLSTVLGLIDVNVGPPEVDEDDLKVTLSSSQSCDSIVVEGEGSESEPDTQAKDSNHSTSLPGAGARLLGLVKRPFLKHRNRELRADAVLKEVVKQLPQVARGSASGQEPGTPAPASPSRARSYTPIQPRQTPLTPRRPRYVDDMD